MIDKNRLFVISIIMLEFRSWSHEICIKEITEKTKTTTSSSEFDSSYYANVFRLFRPSRLLKKDTDLRCTVTF